jgi:hypothetical protein
MIMKNTLYHGMLGNSAENDMVLGLPTAAGAAKKLAQSGLNMDLLGDTTALEDNAEMNIMMKSAMGLAQKEKPKKNQKDLAQSELNMDLLGDTTALEDNAEMNIMMKSAMGLAQKEKPKKNQKDLAQSELNMDLMGDTTALEDNAEMNIMMKSAMGLAQKEKPKELAQSGLNMDLMGDTTALEDNAEMNIMMKSAMGLAQKEKPKDLAQAGINMDLLGDKAVLEDNAEMNILEQDHSLAQTESALSLPTQLDLGIGGPMASAKARVALRYPASANYMDANNYGQNNTLKILANPDAKKSTHPKKANVKEPVKPADKFMATAQQLLGSPSDAVLKSGMDAESTTGLGGAPSPPDRDEAQDVTMSTTLAKVGARLENGSPGNKPYLDGNSVIDTNNAQKEGE